MTFKTDDRVFETSVTTGTGTYTLDGAQTGFQAFSVLGANNDCPYFATDDVNWEVGIGTVLTGPARLQRTTILSSSNSDAAVNWGGGTIKIRCGLPAAMAVHRELSKSVAGSSNVTLTQDEQRRDTLVFTGALTGNIIVYVDATLGEWTVYNNTSGAYTLTFAVTGGSGKLVAQGGVTRLRSDGTNIVDAISYLPGPLSVSSYITSANQICSTGANTAHGASRILMEQESSALSVLTAYGADASTNGTLQLRLRRSDGSNSITAVSISVSGAVTIPGTAGIGMSPTTTGLSVSNTGALATLFVQGDSSATPVSQILNSATSGDNVLQNLYTDASALRGSIDYNRAGGAIRYNTTSDASLKTLLGDAPKEKSTSILASTRLREFYWNDDETRRPQIAPFAQELYDTYRGAVSVGGDYEVEVPAVTELCLVSAGIPEERDEDGFVVQEFVPAVYEPFEIEPARVETRYRPWGVDKTAFTFHLVAGWQDHEARLIDVRDDFERFVDFTGQREQFEAFKATLQ